MRLHIISQNHFNASNLSLYHIKAVLPLYSRSTYDTPDYMRTVHKHHPGPERAWSVTRLRPATIYLRSMMDVKTLRAIVRSLAFMVDAPVLPAQFSGSRNFATCRVLIIRLTNCALLFRALVFVFHNGQPASNCPAHAH